MASCWRYKSSGSLATLRSRMTLHLTTTTSSSSPHRYKCDCKGFNYFGCLKVTRDVALMSTPKEPGFCSYRVRPRNECRCEQVMGFTAVKGRSNSEQGFGAGCGVVRRPSTQELGKACLEQPGCQCRAFDEKGCFRANATLTLVSEIDECFSVRTYLDGCS
jgi:hypothetical protein